MGPVGRTIAQETEKRRRRLKITKKEAAKLLAKKKELDAIRKKNRRKVKSDAATVPTPPLPEPFHPVAVEIVEAVHEGHLEEVVVYAPADPPSISPAERVEYPREPKLPPAKKTWAQSLHEWWIMIGKM